ncbi:reverse transcriptase domain-containing protein [Tanacetum coccineum]
MSTRLLPTTRDRLESGVLMRIPLQVLLDVIQGEHNISYRPRTAVKGQILADFLIEKPETDVVLPQSEGKLHDPWILFTDGSSCVDGSGAGLILTNPEGMEFTYALRFEFTATNNEAEYEALLAGLRIAARMGVRNLEANVDSRLVANHVLGEYVAKEDNMIQYLDKTKSLIQGFDRFTIRQVPRGDNKKADALSKIASTSFAHLSKQVLVEILKNKSISDMEISTVIEEQDPTWMTPIIEFISKGTLPHDQKDARQNARTGAEIELRNGVLYRTFVNLYNHVPDARTFSADYVLPRFLRVHAYALRTTICSSKSLTVLVLLPTMHRHARRQIQKCNDCKYIDNSRANSQQELTPHPPQPGHIHNWGIDISLVPFPCRSGGLKFHIVAIDSFTKWIRRSGPPSINREISLGEGIKSTPEETKRQVVNIATNDDERRIDLDILEERREQAAIREEKAKLKMKGYYDAKVRGAFI